MATLTVWCVSCGNPSSESVQDKVRADSAQRPAAAEKEQCHIRYAKGFTVTYHDGYKVVTVFDPEHPGSKPLNIFVLVPRGRRPPAGVTGTVIEVPVRRIVVRSTTHTPSFSMLGIADRIVGITQGKLVNDQEVSARIRSGSIAEVGVGSGMATQFNIERLLTLHPDLVVSGWSAFPEFAAYLKVQETTELPVALTTDYMESTALGRAEWIKFIAVFFNVDGKAERIFDGMEQRYKAMAAKAGAVSVRPTVMYGMSARGSWWIAGGKSYLASLIRDAGGTYIWADDPTTGSRPVNIESILTRARNAEYWLCQNQYYYSLASLVAEDERYRLFRAFRDGRVYNINGKMGPGGGNDYYEGAAAHPDLLLADMIAIFHPELLPDHKLIWHRRLTATILDGTVQTGGHKK